MLGRELDVVRGGGDAGDHVDGMLAALPGEGVFVGSRQPVGELVRAERLGQSVDECLSVISVGVEVGGPSEKHTALKVGGGPVGSGAEEGSCLFDVNGGSGPDDPGAEAHRRDVPLAEASDAQQEPHCAVG